MKEESTVKPLGRRERFLKTLNHQEPDRVPIDLGSVGGGITDVAYSRVKDTLGINGDEGTTYTTTLTVSQFDERVLQALNVDVRRVGLRVSKRKPGRVEQPDGSWADEWGIFYRKAGYYNQIVKKPLRNATVANLARHPWPDPGDPSLVEGGDARPPLRRPAGALPRALRARGEGAGAGPAEVPDRPRLGEAHPRPVAGAHPRLRARPGQPQHRARRPPRHRPRAAAGGAGGGRGSPSPLPRPQPIGGALPLRGGSGWSRLAV